MTEATTTGAQASLLARERGFRGEAHLPTRISRFMKGFFASEANAQASRNACAPFVVAFVITFHKKL